MREIMFRGKAKDSGDWVYGYLGKWPLHKWRDLATFIIPINQLQDGIATQEEIDPLTVGQFTGLYDKNNKAIYEGDIVRIEFDVDEEPGAKCYEYASIVFSQKHFGWFADFDGDQLSLYEYDDSSIIDVVGNIYDSKHIS